MPPKKTYCWTCSRPWNYVYHGVGQKCPNEKKEEQMAKKKRGSTADAEDRLADLEKERKTAFKALRRMEDVLTEQEDREARRTQQTESRERLARGGKL